MEKSNNLNRTCHTCGKKYRYCYSCPDQKGELYHVMFDCEDCMLIFDTLCDYGQGTISVKDTYEKLKDLMPEDISNYSYGCQKLWKDVLQKINEEHNQKENVQYANNKNEILKDGNSKHVKNYNSYKK